MSIEDKSEITEEEIVQSYHEEAMDPETIDSMVALRKYRDTNMILRAETSP